MNKRQAGTVLDDFTRRAQLLLCYECTRIMEKDLFGRTFECDRPRVAKCREAKHTHVQTAASGFRGDLNGWWDFAFDPQFDERRLEDLWTVRERDWQTDIIYRRYDSTYRFRITP